MGMFASTVTYFTIKIPKKKKKITMLVGWCEFRGWIFWDTWQRDAHLVYVNCSKQQPVNKGVVWQYISKAIFLFFWKGTE